MIAAQWTADDPSDKKLVVELRDARDLIMQLQRELERAREGIDEQRAIVRDVLCAGTSSRRNT